MSHTTPTNKELLKMTNKQIEAYVKRASNASISRMIKRLKTKSK